MTRLVAVLSRLVNRLPMRVSLFMTIAAMGTLGMATTWVSGEILASLAMDNQRVHVRDRLYTGTRELRTRFEQASQELAMRLEERPGLRSAVEEQDKRALEHQLDALFAQATQILGSTRLVRLELLDADRSVLAAAPSAPGDVAPCPYLHDLAGRLRSGDLRKGVSALCVHGSVLLYASVTPLAAARPYGYLHLVADARPALGIVEGTLGMPLRLSLADGRVLYQSPRWPLEGSADKRSTVSYALNAYTDSKTVLSLEAIVDMHSLRDGLEHARRLLMLAVILVTFIAAGITGLLLQKTAIEPLRVLTTQLERVRRDRSRLGEQVKVGGNAEIVELAEGFNEMTARLQELYQSLERQAFTDPLTGLPNRSLFQDRLQQAILTARREHKPFALFIMDLDRFKDINDTLGHHVGDALLRQVAARLRGKLRESDTVARMGGDEFAVLLPTVNGKYADTAARMLLQALRAPFTVEEQSLVIGASIGIVLYPDHGVDANTLMQRADVAMYAAKGTGSGYAFYDGRLDHQHHQPTRLALMGELRHAVEREQFVLYYQPKVDLRSRRAVGLEALVRWRHPDGRLMLPETFVLLMEQTGLIRHLTPWVLNETLAQSRRLSEQGLPIGLCVNLSARDLQDPYLAESIAEQLEAHRVSPQALELEITESAIMTDPARVREMLERLAGMGLKLAIDDFGTGYSSLAYLKRLPAHTIKIDKSFVTGVTQDSNDAAIVRTSIDLAHSLGMQVVAEGVESAEVLERLQALGCDHAQGYYLSRPLSREDLDVWLHKSVWAMNGAAAQPDRLPD